MSKLWPISTAKIDRTLLPERKKEEKNGGAASKTFLWDAGPWERGADNGGALPSFSVWTNTQSRQVGRLIFFQSSC